LPLGWGETQDGGVMKGKDRSLLRVQSRTTTALLEDRGAHYGLIPPEKQSLFSKA
jgi:hypothetical protein